MMAAPGWRGGAVLGVFTVVVTIAWGYTGKFCDNSRTFFFVMLKQNRREMNTFLLISCIENQLPFLRTVLLSSALYPTNKPDDSIFTETATHSDDEIAITKQTYGTEEVITRKHLRLINGSTKTHHPSELYRIRNVLEACEYKGSRTRVLYRFATALCFCG